MKRKHAITYAETVFSMIIVCFVMSLLFPVLTGRLYTAGITGYFIDAFQVGTCRNYPIEIRNVYTRNSKMDNFEDNPVQASGGLIGQTYGGSRAKIYESKK